MGFTGFYWVLLGSTEFYRVLLGFTGFLPSFNGFFAESQRCAAVLRPYRAVSRKPSACIDSDGDVIDSHRVLPPPFSHPRLECAPANQFTVLNRILQCRSGVRRPRPMAWRHVILDPWPP